MRCSPVIHFLSRKLGRVMLVVTVMMLSAIPVQADILVSPLRVHLDEKQQTATVIMRNPSNGPRTYRLEWVEQRMSVDGVQTQYKEGEVVQHSPASPYLRLSPRQVTVPAGSNQSVRIQYRPSAEMKPGEYRSHLFFRVVPELSEPFSVTEMGGGEGINLKLNMQLSIAIPVIVKYQLSEPPQVKITEVEPVPATEPGQSAQLAVTLVRSGIGGSFGQVVVEMQAGPDAPVERIGLAGNVSVYTDLDQRRLVLNLRDQNIPHGAWLRVAYEGMDEFKGLLWDEQVFQIR